MANLKQSILLLGEGPTEFFYFNSIRPLFKGLTIKPDYPKHTNLLELESKIIEGIRDGYSYIFCVIDMDTKDEEPERTRYYRLKQKYSRTVRKPNKGIHCEVKFFETHRCTELFFLYYFCYTSKLYLDQESIIKDINKHCHYIKTIEFCIKTKGLNSYFEKHEGSINRAISNAEQSIAERNITNRNYTYSELGKMLVELKNLTAQ